MTNAELMTKAGEALGRAQVQTQKALNPPSVARVPVLARRAIRNLKLAIQLVETYIANKRNGRS